MNFVHFIATTIFYEAPDGRIVFQPLGRLGPCYRLTPAQRKTRAKIFVGYLAVVVVASPAAAIYFHGVAAFLLRVTPLILAGIFVLFWLFARGLPVTEHPPRIPPSYRQELNRRTDQMMDIVHQWYLLIGGVISIAMTTWLGFDTGEWAVSLLGGLFGAGLVMYSVRGLRRKR